VRTSFGLRSVTVVDLMEDTAQEGSAAAVGEALQQDAQTVTFALRPFQILSLRLSRA